MPSNEELNYIGVCRECDGVVIFIAGDMRDKKEQAKEVAKIIRFGLDLQRWSNEQIRTTDKFGHHVTCSHGPGLRGKPKQEALFDAK